MQPRLTFYLPCGGKGKRTCKIKQPECDSVRHIVVFVIVASYIEIPHCVFITYFAPSRNFFHYLACTTHGTVKLRHVTFVRSVQRKFGTHVAAADDETHRCGEQIT